MWVAEALVMIGAIHAAVTQLRRPERTTAVLAGYLATIVCLAVAWIAVQHPEYPLPPPR